MAVVRVDGGVILAGNVDTRGEERGALVNVGDDGTVHGPPRSTRPRRATVGRDQCRQRHAGGDLLVVAPASTC